MAFIRTKQGQVEVDGVKLDIVCSRFSNRIFILISEVDKIGTMFEVWRDTVLPVARHTYSVRTLIGKDDERGHVIARAVAGHTLQSHSHLLLALGLREHSLALVPSLITHLDTLAVW